MPKPDWKTKPHERKRMTLQQENSELKKRLEALVQKIDVLTYDKHHLAESVKYFRDERDGLEGDANRYRVLRTKDVMVLDGEPMYLKDADLDKYCDDEKNKMLWNGSLAGILRNVSISPSQMYMPKSMFDVAKKLLKETSNGNDTRSKSEEADQKDSGHHTDILRYADWYRLRKQRGS